MRGVLLLLAVFITLTCFSQSAELEKVFDQLEKKNQAMGSVSIRQAANLVYERGFGFASIENNQKANPETVYRIGSISKTFTATIILQMASEGKLALEGPLSLFFPKWPMAKKISIEQLLRHQSGIHNFGDDRTGNYRNQNPETREEVLAIFENAEMDFKPGTKTDYNNANYVVLSLIAEEIDSLTFVEVFENRIQKPLGLQRTTVGAAINPSQNEASSYYWKRSWQPNSVADTKTLMGAGAVSSTANEVNIFLEALFSHQFFDEVWLQKMLETEGNLGLGIFQYSFYNKSCYGHSGSIDAFESFTAYFPKEKVSITLLLNAERKELNDILKEILVAYFQAN